MIDLSERPAAEREPTHEATWRPCHAMNSNEATPLLSVIVPVYNEVKTIDEVLQRVLSDQVNKHVIVIDDASTDGTSELLKNWKGRGQIELIRHDQNRGKGAAIRTGLAHARGQFTIIQDADLEYDPGDYAALIEPLLQGQADVIYGTRYSQWATARRSTNRLFRWGVSALNVAVRVVYGARLTDEATCYKLFPTPILQAMDLQCERFEFCPEVTAKTCRMGKTIREIPISYSPRGTADGKKLRLRDGITALRTLWRWRSWTPTSKEPCTATPVHERRDNHASTGLRRITRRDQPRSKLNTEGRAYQERPDATESLLDPSCDDVCVVCTRSNWKKYSSTNPLQQYLIQRFINRVCATVDALPAGELLDVGCGEGVVLNHLSGRTRHLRLTGVDCDAEAVAFARKTNPRIRIELGNIFSLGHLKQSADIVLALEVLEHLNDPLKALAELRRATRRYCVLSVPHEPWFRLANLLRGRNVSRGGNHPEHVQNWTSRQFVRMVEEHFRVIGIWHPFPWTLVLGESLDRERE